MILAPRALALAASATLAVTGLAGSASAATTTRTVALHPTRMASHARGDAVVTQTAPGDYTVTITASGLPAPATLLKRHVYMAWVSDGKGTQQQMMTRLAAIPLHTTGAGAYSGRRTVMVATVARVFITAESSTMVHAPVMPFQGVLISSMMR